MIKWDPTISLGTVLALIAMLAPILVLITRLAKIELKVEEMWEWFRKHSKVIVD